VKSSASETSICNKGVGGRRGCDQKETPSGLGGGGACAKEEKGGGHHRRLGRKRMTEKHVQRAKKGGPL